MIKNDEVIELVELARQQLELEQHLKDAEDKLVELKCKYTTLTELSIPALMRNLGVESFTLAGGSIIALKTKIVASITEEKRDKAFKWLVDNGFGGLIKRELKLNFGKGEDDLANNVLESIKQYGPSDKHTVHPATLAAFVKEQLENGSNIPMDLFGVHSLTKSQVI